MFDHVEVPVSDLARSGEFYATVLAPLGLEASEGPEMVEFGALTLVPGTPTQRMHFAFMAETRDVVDAFHRAGVDAGYRDNGAPGLRDYAPDYHAAYLLDPDRSSVLVIR